MQHKQSQLFSEFHIFRKEITTKPWEINHPELTYGLLQTCIIKAITLRYSLPKHNSGISKEKVCYG